VKGELRQFVICHLSFIGYWLSAIGYFSSEPRAVIQVDGDEQQDSFDHVEREISAGKSEQKPDWT
jgi:hypothetical protein